MQSETPQTDAVIREQDNHGRYQGCADDGVLPEEAYHAMVGNLMRLSRSLERSLSRMRDALDTAVLRAGYIQHYCKDVVSMRLEAREIEHQARSALAPARAEGTGDAAPAAPDSGEAMSITLWADGAMAIKAAWVHSLIKQGYSPGRAGELVNERLSDYAEQS